jgi:hypothetical protein
VSDELTVWRIVDKFGTQCNGRFGYPDHTAIYQSTQSVDAAIRKLNNPNRAPASPQPTGRPYRRQEGTISWTES